VSSRRRQYAKPEAGRGGWTLRHAMYASTLPLDATAGSFEPARHLCRVLSKVLVIRSGLTLCRFRTVEAAERLFFQRFCKLLPVCAVQVSVAEAKGTPDMGRKARAPGGGVQPHSRRDRQSSITGSRGPGSASERRGSSWRYRRRRNQHRQGVAALPRMTGRSASPLASLIAFESPSPCGKSSGSRMTAATPTGPASGPRPASSIPATPAFGHRLTFDVEMGLDHRVWPSGPAARRERSKAYKIG